MKLSVQTTESVAEPKISAYHKNYHTV